jgi:hypothetical protein
MEAQDILTETVPVTDDTTASADTPAEATPPDVAASEADYEYPDEIDEEPAAPGFAALGLSEPILKAVAEKGYLNPTPIQAQAIPFVLMGRDVLGCAQTGTGKTAGFTLPMIDILSGSRARARMPRSLILEPTRELALQVAENFVEYGKYLKLTHALVIGGESMSDQKDLLMRGVDVLIATPGRLIDMFERGAMLLTDTRILVIDEADRMLDMGFIPDVERIVSLLPANRQTLFFSATMAPEIRRLADVFLQNPKEITVSKPASVATTITEGMVLVNDTDKREALRRRRLIAASGGTGAAETRFRGVTPRLLPSLVHRDRLTDAPLVDAVMGMAERVGREAFLRQQTAIMHRPDSRPLLPGIRVPTLVAAGREDILTPPDHAAEMQALIPGAGLHLIDACGHLAPMERPDEVSAMLKSWLVGGV